MVEIRCVVDAKAQLGESTYWDPAAEVLWWIDIYGRTIHRFEPETGRDDIFNAPEYLGCLAVRARRAGRLDEERVLLLRSGAARFEPIAEPEAHLPDTRFNDGKTDRQGRFWSGSMFEAPGKPPVKSGALYRLDTDLYLRTRSSTASAAPTGSPGARTAGTLYFADSHTPYVWAYDFDPVSGAVGEPAGLRRPHRYQGHRRRLHSRCGRLLLDDNPLPEQGPRYDPAGKLMRTIELPTDLPTCCEFGGPDLGTLYVTTAVYRRAPTGQAGGLFALDGLGAKGLPLVPFAG